MTSDLDTSDLVNYIESQACRDFLQRRYGPNESYDGLLDLLVRKLAPYQ